MKIIVIGTGYVGLVQGVCLAELGNNVVCVDIDKNKINQLKQGVSPIYEPGIEDLIKHNIAANRIQFSISLNEHIENADIIFIAVGTPAKKNGDADLKYVLKAATDIGKNIKSYKIIVNKSTVPIGTGQLVKQTIKKHYHGDFDVLSNPEFLREGSAIDDFIRPDRIIIGTNNGRAAAFKLAKLYQVLGSEILITNLETSEMIKYASNSYLATQISFINSIARICERVGADVDKVAKGMKLDKRIGERAFLKAGLGYGGSCFPKDVQTLIKIASDNRVNFGILEETEKVNKNQRIIFVNKIIKVLGNLKGKQITIWGGAFKPETDDIRDAPAITIIEKLLKLGAKIKVYDPAAENNLKKILPQVQYFPDSIEACQDSDALVVATDWNEFKQIDLKKVTSALKQPYIFDGRNIYSQKMVEKYGIKYFSVGRE